MTNRLAIIGASYLQVPLIERANEMGYETHVFAWAADDVGEKICHEFHPISIIEFDEITEVCRELDICGICTIGSDIGSVTVGYVADKLGLPGNPWESVQKSTNKHLMREAFRLGGDPSPRSYLVDETTDPTTLEIDYPVIVKPTDRSGSRGVTRIESVEEARDAIKFACEAGFEHKAVFEEFVTGQEYSVEGISYHGEHTILAITYKFTNEEPHFVETGHLEPGPIPPSVTREQVEAVLKHALTSLGVQNGATCSELRITADGKMNIMEIAARMGGDCIGTPLCVLSTGTDYVGNVVRIAVGEAPDNSVINEPRAAHAHYIITEDDMRLLEQAKADPNVRVDLEIMEHPENLGTEIVDSSDRPGVFVVSSPNIEDLYPYLKYPGSVKYFDVPF